MNNEEQRIREACEEYLANWDRAEWQNDHGTFASDVDPNIPSEGDYIVGGTIDPDEVEGESRRLRVGRSWQGWDCREGWTAYQAGDRLVLNWWRASVCGERIARDLWIVVDATFFEEPEDD